MPLGSTEDLLPLSIALKTGTPNFGGPVATAGGLVFIGAAALVLPVLAIALVLARRRA